MIVFQVSLNFEPAKDRSSRPEVFCKKCVLRNFAKFAEKHLCQSLFFNQVYILMKKVIILTKIQVIMKSLNRKNRVLMRAI